MTFSPSFEIGATVTHQQIVDEFKCGNMGGMRRSHTTNTLLIISDHTKSLYDDKWYGNELHYTGMGKIGDQTLTKQNRTLAESETNGVAVHLFEVLEASRYIYHGRAKLCGAPYQEEQKDETGNLRKVWMFPLSPMDKDSVIEESAYRAYSSTQETKATGLSDRELEEEARIRSRAKAASRKVTSSQHVRDPYISEYAKRRANGVCQLCKQEAPFCDKSGKPYLESHHIVWLGKGGADSIDNTVALCPNCHRRMHVVNAPHDVQTLEDAIK